MPPAGQTHQALPEAAGTCVCTRVRAHAHEDFEVRQANLIQTVGSQTCDLTEL